MKVVLPSGLLGVFVLFSSNIANAKNNFVTIPLELLQLVYEPREKTGPILHVNCVIS